MEGLAHLRHHLGMRFERDADGRPEASMALLPQHRTRHGAVSAGAVATLVDVASGQTTGDEGVGAAVTSHLALRLPPLHGCTRLLARPTVARSGRTSVVNVVHVFDPERDAIVGAATVTFTVLPGASGSHVPDDTLDVPPVWSHAVQAPRDLTTDDYVGVRRRPADDGAYALAQYEMDLGAHLRNVNGVLHGGGLVLFAEHVALLAAADAGLRRPVVDEIDVHFLAAATSGPLVGTVTVVGHRRRSRLSLLVEATDGGRQGRRVGVALVGAADASRPTP
jgi:acyl-coenzyme A thioesterase PaaI-like protein